MINVKKFLFAAVAVALAFTAAACTRADDYDKISQLRTNVYFGTDGEAEFTAYAEERESPLCADGIPGERIAAIVIKIAQKSAFSGTNSIFIKVGDKEYSATPTAVADNVLRAVIPVDELPKGEFYAALSGEKESAATLTSVFTGVDHRAAFETAKAELAGKLVYDGNALTGEFFVRALYENGVSYWYVGYVTQENVFSLLISEDGKQVIAAKDFKNDAK